VVKKNENNSRTGKTSRYKKREGKERENGRGTEIEGKGTGA